ncbi:MAG: WG repeat-containing protein [Paramuribaculum sp.]|nr:WG repeat-containing protein [Paramuribaculum sp.]MDE5836594.1 WG repeat-containing protein [Paramuribaculum sp.]
MYRFILLLIAICVGMTNHINAFVVKSIDELKNDISARTNTRVDKNNNPCALVRLNLPTLDQLTFGNMVVGEVTQLPGEYVMYLAPGTQQLTYSCKGVEKTINFSDYDINVEGKHTYRIILKDDKAPTESITSAYITTNYDNQIVLVDGIPMGETPVLIESIEPGQHTIAIPNVHGVTMDDKVVTIKSGEKNMIDLTLHPESIKSVDIMLETLGGDSGGESPIWGLSKIKQNGKYGMVDYTGVNVIPCEFDYIHDEELWNGCFMVKNRDLVGLYQPGKGLVLPCIYDKIYTYEFKDKSGLVKVCKDGKWGIKAPTGATIMPIEYDGISVDVADYASAKNVSFIAGIGKDRKGIFDSTGKCVFRSNYDKLGYSNGGYSLFSRGNKYGIVNLSSGQERFLPDNYFPGYFKSWSIINLNDINENLFMIVDKNTNKIGFMDTNLNLVIPAKYNFYEYEEDRYFRNGKTTTLRVGGTPGEDSGKKIVFNKFGKEVINAEKQGFVDITYSDAGPGFYVVKDSNDTQGVYDALGHSIIPCGKYKSISIKADKLNGNIYFKCSDESSTDVYDVNNNFLFTLPDNTLITYVYDNLITIEQWVYDDEGHLDTTYGYISPDGNIYADCIYSGYGSHRDNDRYTFMISQTLGSISDGIGILRLGDRYGFINTSGKIVVPLIYTAVTPFRNGISYVRDKAGKWHKIYRKDLKQ